MAANSSKPVSPLPADDPRRELTVADPESPKLRHIALAGDTYTILVAGEQTNGRYCLVDMHVPRGGGPPPHRHDFEEMFTLLEGEIEFTFRGKTLTASARTTINIPANAPHSFRNTSAKPARMLCMCTPAGQEKLFIEVGDPVDSRTAPPPMLTKQEQEQWKQKAFALMGEYRTEMV